MFRKLFQYVLLIAIVIMGLATTVAQAQDILHNPTWVCDGTQSYHFTMSREGRVEVINDSDRDEPGQSIDIYIDTQKTNVLYAPPVKTGESKYVGQVETPGNLGFSWFVDGQIDCNSHGVYPPVVTATSTLTSTPTFTFTPSATNTVTVTFTPSPSPTFTVTNLPTKTLEPSATPSPTLPPTVETLIPSPSPTNEIPTIMPSPSFTPTATYLQLVKDNGCKVATFEASSDQVGDIVYTSDLPDELKHFLIVEGAKATFSWENILGIKVVTVTATQGSRSAQQTVQRLSESAACTPTDTPSNPPPKESYALECIYRWNGADQTHPWYTLPFGKFEFFGVDIIETKYDADGSRMFILGPIGVTDFPESRDYEFWTRNPDKMWAFHLDVHKNEHQDINWYTCAPIGLDVGNGGSGSGTGGPTDPVRAQIRLWIGTAGLSKDPGIVLYPNGQAVSTMRLVVNGQETGLTTWTSRITGCRGLTMSQFEYQPLEGDTAEIWVYMAQHYVIRVPVPVGGSGSDVNCSNLQEIEENVWQGHFYGGNTYENWYLFLQMKTMSYRRFVELMEKARPAHQEAFAIPEEIRKDSMIFPLS